MRGTGKARALSLLNSLRATASSALIGLSGGDTNVQWRLCFKWQNGKAYDVEMLQKLHLIRKFSKSSGLISKTLVLGMASLHKAVSHKKFHLSFAVV